MSHGEIRKLPVTRQRLGRKRWLSGRGVLWLEEETVGEWTLVGGGAVKGTGI